MIFKPTKCPLCNRGEVAEGVNVAAMYFCLNVECRAWSADGVIWKKPEKLPALA